MQTWRVHLVAVAVVLVLAGCEPVPQGSDEPMLTDGPNQVVLKVPAMTCPTCPASVGTALTTVAWIDSDTIKTDGKLRQAKFTVKDRAKFNADEVKQALGKRYADGVKVLAGPTDK